MPYQDTRCIINSLAGAVDDLDLARTLVAQHVDVSKHDDEAGLILESGEVADD